MHFGNILVGSVITATAEDKDLTAATNVKKWI